ncbi:dicarboxylate/amino acid:cation symporter [Marinobacter nanhaiticus D15-8W]|uniref:Dicarboxylate/amino acid:cation symporter n=1 Tax=Marinobacter nanhaiticus D15-8W TaxID=626887 RepID=N6WXV0_9GAMM|nr:dicarboxylate/amino acid:cation symporter [Marinobacter nanhaiticus]ENO15912.1 dicarboxylate/amino acid:cation symporter [Marinobacter nanhaiticus D15-8W]BES73230.1 dicarboxylate/amino acid:cation symporter [Marinobacter nanhaiticus D15-8W]
MEFDNQNEPALRPRPLRYLSIYLTGLVRERLWLKVLIGMFAGLVTGALLGPSVGIVERETGVMLGNWLAFPGKLFLATIQMIVIPLVVASVVRGLAASENLEQLRTLGLRVTAFFVVTTAIAASIGLWIGGVIKPGQMMAGLIDIGEQSQPAPDTTSLPGMSELPQALLGLLPGNPLGAMVQGQMLQVVIFSIIIGIALVTMAPTQARPMLDLLDSLQQICMTVVKWAMRLAPYAVFGLMAQLTTTVGFSALAGMAAYVITVLLGLVMMLGIYLFMLSLVGGLRPWPFLKKVRDVLLLAFSTSSSAAVMPLSIRTAETKLDVRPSISQFVIPLGATINMNGTALYQAVATAFLAQVYGVELGFASMALVVAMAVGSSIGSPATPGVGIVILAMVLESVGIPAGGIALIMGVDRILDMSRTAINVTGDLVTCRLMEIWSGEAPKSAVETA